MKSRKILLSVLAAALLFLPSYFVMIGVISTNVRAASDLGLTAACNDPNNVEAQSSTYCKNRLTGDPDPNNDPAKKLIIKITNIVAYAGGAMAVFIMIYAGLRYVVSVGNSEKTATALKTIIYTAIGLAVIIAARTIIVFAINHIT